MREFIRRGTKADGQPLTGDERTILNASLRDMLGQYHESCNPAYTVVTKTADRGVSVNLLDLSPGDLITMKCNSVVELFVAPACCRCGAGAEDTESQTTEEAARRLSQLGWRKSRQEYFCPDCSSGITNT